MREANGKAADSAKIDPKTNIRSSQTLDQQTKDALGNVQVHSKLCHANYRQFEFSWKMQKNAKTRMDKNLEEDEFVG